MNYLIHILILLILLSGCSKGSQISPIKAERLNLDQQSSLVELTIPQISPCDDSGNKSVLLDQTAPLTLLVHGCWSSAGKFTALSDVFAFSGQQTACFNYDDRASLKQSAEQLYLSLKTILSLTDIDQMTVIGHSQGGLVSRRTFTREFEWNTEDVRVSLITISSPFAGITASEHCGSSLAAFLTLGLSKGICYLISGEKWDEIYPGADFIQKPGKLVDNIKLHLKIVTDEKGSCRVRSNKGICVKDDFVFSLEEQYQITVDNNSVVRNVEIQEGHVAVIGSEKSPPKKLIRTLQGSGLLAEISPQRAEDFNQMLMAIF